MYINAEIFLNAVAVITAIGTIIGIIATVVKWFEKQNKQDKDIKSLNEEQCMISYCMLASLDGLKQLGANGKVTEAHEKLSKHISQKAHDQK